MNAERENDRTRRTLPHCDCGDVECRRLICLPHIAGPLMMEVVFALDSCLFGFCSFIAFVARIEKTLEKVFRFCDGIGIHCGRLHNMDWTALDSPGAADLVAAFRQDDVIESGAGKQRARWWNAETHGQWNRLLILVMRGDDLPHVRSGRRLERPDIPPPEIHAVVADVASAVEVLANHTTDAAADGQLRLQRGVTDRSDVLVDVEIVCNDLFLTRRGALRHLDRRHRARQRICDLADAIDGSIEAEHLVEDTAVGKEIRNCASVRLAFHTIEEEHRTAVEVLLESGDLEIGIDLDVSGQNVALRLEKLQSLAQRSHIARRSLRSRFFLGNCGHFAPLLWMFNSVNSLKTSSLSCARQGAGRRTRPGVSLN